jgi:hypothetical protein
MREMGGVDDRRRGDRQLESMRTYTKMVADWLMVVYSNLHVEIRENSWKKAGFEWF